MPSYGDDETVMACGDPNCDVCQGRDWSTCPECGALAVSRTSPGDLPVCVACDWTGWPDDEDA